MANFLMTLSQSNEAIRIGKLHTAKKRDNNKDITMEST